MLKKRLWIVSIAISACLSVILIIGAQRSHPASASNADIARPLTVGVCNINTGPCLQETNNGKGAGIAGVSLGGRGIMGKTEFNSTSSANGAGGVLGTDLSTSGAFNSGVSGLSVRGTGVLGNSTSGVGVSGQSTNGPGVTATSSNNDGVDGFTSNPSLTRSPRSGVVGLDNSSDGGHGNGGVVGFSTNGVGVAGNSTHWVGVNAIGGDWINPTDYPALSIVGNSAGGNANDLIDACPPATANPCDSIHTAFTVSSSGAVFAPGGITTNTLAGDVMIGNDGVIDVSGQYQKNFICVAGCSAATTASAGRSVVTYAPMVGQPTIEDFGETQLVNGQTYVHLDAKFANVVEQRPSYLVFITPEGDANTLYVTQKSMGGFTVRESHAGRSTLMFSYRIVAKPFGSREARLPMVELPKLRASLPKQRAWHPGAVVPVH